MSWAFISSNINRKRWALTGLEVTLISKVKHDWKILHERNIILQLALSNSNSKSSSFRTNSNSPWKFLEKLSYSNKGSIFEQNLWYLERNTLPISNSGKVVWANYRVLNFKQLGFWNHLSFDLECKKVFTWLRESGISNEIDFRLRDFRSFFFLYSTRSRFRTKSHSPCDSN